MLLESPAPAWRFSSEGEDFALHWLERRVNNPQTTGPLLPLLLLWNNAPEGWLIPDIASDLINNRRECYVDRSTRKMRGGLLDNGTPRCCKRCPSYADSVSGCPSPSVGT
jgi:hypothetical protein